jgi:hypothetical protein
MLEPLKRVQLLMKFAAVHMKMNSCFKWSQEKLNLPPKNRDIRMKRFLAISVYYSMKKIEKVKLNLLNGPIKNLSKGFQMNP